MEDPCTRTDSTEVSVYTSNTDVMRQIVTIHSQNLYTVESTK
jgi:hypothetical protein